MRKYRRIKPFRQAADASKHSANASSEALWPSRTGAIIVSGRCRVSRLNLDGDGQGDLAGHGGEQRAVFVYQIESYRYWQEQLKRAEFVHGQFGENLTVEG